MFGWAAEGRKICASCEVRMECLDWALAHNEHGLWGGLTDLERRHLRGYTALPRAGKRPPACPECEHDVTTHTSNKRTNAVCVRCLHRWSLEPEAEGAIT
jgi:hypothetical protein